MKFSKFILAILITISLFAFSANKASAFGNERENERQIENSRGGDDHKGGGSGTCLPINGQAWFLLIAGLAIGSYVVYNNGKEVKLKTVAVKR